MKLPYVLLLLICVLTGCRNKLNAEQCKTIFAAEIKFAMQRSLAPGGSVDDLLGAARYGDPHACELGKTRYKVKDYDCIVAAKGDSEVEMCLDSAHRRMDAS